ncbi:unnamed protein product [Acidithrix sp. C25]|nr:unnamed protein product [Acidithrix sp. C25]
MVDGAKFWCKTYFLANYKGKRDRAIGIGLTLMMPITY